jgi:hypothetical protein
MARAHSYTITANNNSSEREAIDFLLSENKNFIKPDKESRKIIMEVLNIDQKFRRAFDLILIPGHTNLEEVIKFRNVSEITLVELKTTKKHLPNNPGGFFFGATESEFKLASSLGDQYRFCFVSLHKKSKSYTLLSLEELENLIVTRRIQYQINLKKS